ncbi:hypothetical protein D3C72_640330 [compost metagenome]
MLLQTKELFTKVWELVMEITFRIMSVMGCAISRFIQEEVRTLREIRHLQHNSTITCKDYGAMEINCTMEEPVFRECRA